MFYVYERCLDQEDWQALEVWRGDSKEKAFAIKNRRLKYNIEVFIYENDKEIWRGVCALCL